MIENTWSYTYAQFLNELNIRYFVRKQEKTIKKMIKRYA